MKLNYDYSKLKGRIKEKYGTQGKFADEMERSYTSISNKLNNAVEFTQSEIDKACILLDIMEKEFKEFFFTQRVQKTEFNKNNPKD